MPRTCSPRSSARSGSRVAHGERGQAPAARSGHGGRHGHEVAQVRGRHVEKGEPLFEIDTDKVTQEVESDYAGVLLKIALAEGEAPVGQTIAWIGKEGEEVAAEAHRPAAARPRSRPRRTARPEREVSDSAAVRRAKVSDASESNGGRIKASPLARRIARERGIDLASLRGTGPDGRIVAEDVERGGARPRRAARPDGRDRVGPADEHPQDDRAPPDRRVAGARLPADGQRRHDARERARRRAPAS